MGKQLWPRVRFGFLKLMNGTCPNLNKVRLAMKVLHLMDPKWVGYVYDYLTLGGN
jgi:hypothetical protein